MRTMDTLLLSMSAIRSHKLRSSLTLVGIVLGVASIIAVMTGISVIQTTMEKEMAVLGAQTFQVQKWPAGGFASAEQRRKAMKRPPVTVDEAKTIREEVSTADLVGSELWDFGFTAEYRGESTNPNVSICGGTPEYAENNTHYVGLGRNISPLDVRAARRVVVIGYAIAQKLFPFTDPIDKDIRVDGREYRVVGVFDEKKSSFGAGFDNYVLMPITVFQNVYGLTDRQGFPRSVNVTVRAISPDRVDDAIEETRQVLRRIRRVPPGEEDNFEFFSTNSLIENFNKTTAGVKTGAFVIGIIALLVAGIGIMNIMLVSVTERTKEIGIRKSLGAKRGNILLQFLVEAIFLCNVGGLIGIAVGLGLGNVISFITSFEASAPMQWAVIGMLFCTTIGLVFGMVPALKAARLHPIEALRYE